MNMKLAGIIIVGFLSGSQLEALSRQQVHLASTIAGAGTFGLLNKFVIQRSCPFAWKDSAYNIGFKEECMGICDSKKVVDPAVKKDLGVLGASTMGSFGLIEWLLWGYTPDARYKKANQVLKKIEQVPLCITKMTKSNSDEIMEESDCYRGVDAIPLVNASELLHIYASLADKAKISLEKALNDEPDDTSLHDYIVNGIKQIEKYKSVIRHNERLVKNHSQWLDAVSVNNANKISNAQKETAQANSSIAHSAKWQVFISVLEFIFGSTRR